MVQCLELGSCPHVPLFLLHVIVSSNCPLGRSEQPLSFLSEGIDLMSRCLCDALVGGRKTRAAASTMLLMSFVDLPSCILGSFSQF